MVTTKEKKAAQQVDTTPPLEKLRKSFIVGRPSEVQHDPVSGVAAAQAELRRLEAAIADMELQAQCQIALVVLSTGENRGGRLFVVGGSAESAARVITSIAGLQQPRLMGLVYAVVESSGAFEFWTKAFVRGRAAEQILDLAVADGLRRLQDGGSN